MSVQCGPVIALIVWGLAAAVLRPTQCRQMSCYRLRGNWVSSHHTSPAHQNGSGEPARSLPSQEVARQVPGNPDYNFYSSVKGGYRRLSKTTVDIFIKYLLTHAGFFPPHLCNQGPQRGRGKSPKASLWTLFSSLWTCLPLPLPERGWNRVRVWVWPAI